MSSPGGIIYSELPWSWFDEVSKEHGDAFYLLDVARFRQRFEAMQASFQKHYPRARVAYSYKTNYTPALCASVESWGGLSEVVSGMEFDLACQLGVPGERIVFNGPCKSPDEVQRALRHGALVNLDSWSEVEAAVALAQAEPARELRVGVRCNFEVEGSAPSRFGFDVDDPGFGAIFDRLRSCTNIELFGLHHHGRLPSRSAEAYAQIARRMVALAAQYFPGGPPRMLNIGGGFCSPMPKELQESLGFVAPTYEEYAAAVGPVMAEAFPGDDGPWLYLEPGVAITADIMDFVARVMDVKTIRGQAIAQVAGSVYNIKPTKNLHNLPMRVVSAGASRQRDPIVGPLDVTGFTCMEDDILYRGHAGEVGANDFVQFGNVGAYTLVLKPPFIRPCAPVLVMNGSGDAVEGVTKRREETADVFSTFAFPGT